MERISNGEILNYYLGSLSEKLEAEAIIKCENTTVHILDEDRLRELSKNLYMTSL